MVEEFGYRETSLSEINAGLNSMLAGMDKEGPVRFARSTTSNVLLGVNKLSAEVDQFISELAMIHPSRFFLISLEPGLPSLEAQVALRCHGLSASQKVCSEVVRISCPADMLGALPGVVRANLIAGTNNELFVLDAGVNDALMKVLMGLANQVFFDSAELERRLYLISEFAAFADTLVDLTWLELEPWRQELKEAFDRPLLRGFLPALSLIKLEAQVPRIGPPGGHLPWRLALMAGWLISCLKLEVVGYRAGVFEAVTAAGRRVYIQTGLQTDSERCGLSALEFMFLEPGKKEVRLSVKNQKNEVLETTVQPFEDFKSVRPLRRESRFAYVRRYFQIGEAGFSYRDALRNALDVLSLIEDLV